MKKHTELSRSHISKLFFQCLGRHLQLIVPYAVMKTSVKSEQAPEILYNLKIIEEFIFQCLMQTFFKTYDLFRR